MKKLLCLSLVFQMTFAPSIMAQTLNESFSTTKPLTDQEQHEANTYYHQGKAGDYLKKQCDQLSAEFKTQMGCNDESGAPGQVLGGTMGGILEEMIPKLYGMIGMVAMATGGGTIKMKPKAAKTPETPKPPKEGVGADKTTEKAGEKKSDEKKDLCIYIPMLGEAISMAAQQFSEKNIQQQMTDSQKQNSLRDQQKESLYAVANVHKARAKTATMQASVFAATAACYIAYVASGASMVEKDGIMMGVKIGAASLVSTIYFMKAAKHRDYESRVKGIADKLPGEGECNPHTQTQCFCAEPSSQKSDLTNFMKVCVPPELAKNPNANPNSIPCATLESGKAKVDPSCSCKRNNSCLTGQLSVRAASIDFGSVDIADPLRILSQMNGEFDAQRIQPIVGSINARTKAALAKMPITDVPSVTLNEKQRELAKELNKMGVPARAAAFGAAADIAPVNPSFSPGILSSTPSFEETESSVQKSAGYNSSSGSGSGSRRSDKTDFSNPFAKGGRPEAIQVETFAEQAFAQAEITKDTSVGIFDLISNRYRRSAWNKFDLNKKLDAEEVPATSPSSEP